MMSLDATLCCIYRYIHEYVVIMIFEFAEYCFIKSIKYKFKFWNFLSEKLKFCVKTFA